MTPNYLSNYLDSQAIAVGDCGSPVTQSGELGRYLSGTRET